MDPISVEDFYAPANQQDQTPPDVQQGAAQQNISQGPISTDDFYGSGQTQSPPQPGPIGAAIAGAAPAAAPITAAIAAGTRGAALGTALAPELAPWSSIAGGLAAGLIASGVVGKIQDWLRDRYGPSTGPLSKPYEAAAEEQQPLAYNIGRVAPIAAGMTTGNVTPLVRAASAGLMGGVDVMQQGIEKGFGNINPTEALTQAAAGAILPQAREWVGGARPQLATKAPAVGEEAAPTPAGTEAGDMTPATSAMKGKRADSKPQTPEGRAAQQEQETHIAPFNESPTKGTAGDQPAVDGANIQHEGAASEDSRYGATIRGSGSDRQYPESNVQTRQGIGGAPPTVVDTASIPADTAAALSPEQTPTTPSAPVPPTEVPRPGPAEAQGAQAPAPEVQSPVPTVRPSASPSTANSMLAPPSPEMAAARGVPAPEDTSTGLAGQVPNAQQLIGDAMNAATKRQVVEQPMPSIANSSKDINGPVVIDPQVVKDHPDYIEPLKVHETVEGVLMAHGMDPDMAHDIATRAERTKAESMGINWDKYSQYFKDISPQIEAQRIMPDTWDALDLHEDPYAAIGHHTNKDIQGEFQQAIGEPPLSTPRAKNAPPSGNAPEKVTGFAVKLKDGTIFTGASHDEAIKAAIKAKGGGVEFGPGGQGLFVTSTGRLISNKEAIALKSTRDALGLPESKNPPIKAETVPPSGNEPDLNEIPDFLRRQPPAAQEAIAKSAGQPWPTIAPEVPVPRSNLTEADRAAIAEMQTTAALNKKNQTAARLAKLKASQQEGGKYFPGAAWDVNTSKWVPASQRPTSLGAAATPGQKAIFTGGLLNAWRNFKENPLWFENPIRKVFSPQSVSSETEQAALGSRMVHGQRMQDDAQNAATLTEAQRAINQAPAKDVMDYLMHFEEDVVPKGNLLTPIQKDVKTVLDNFKEKIKTLPEGDQVNFIDNYFPRSGLWANDEENLDTLRNFLTEQGSAAGLKERKFPTISDALNAGVKFNPDMLRPDGAPDMMKVLGKYMNQMGTYIESQKMLKEYIDRGIAHVYDFTKEADHIPPGEVALEGRTYRGLPVFTPQDVATIYNNFWSPGVHGSAGYGDLYDTWMHGKNMMSAATLLGGGYHVSAIGIESMIMNASTGIEKMIGGDIAGGLKTIGKAPGAPYLSYQLGKKGLAGYLDPKMHPELQPAIQALRDAGFTFAPHQALMENPEFQYMNSPGNNFFSAFNRGSLAMETAAAKQRVREAADKNFAVGAGQVGKEAFNLAGKAIQTMMYPLFQHYIPLVKNGVALEKMASWMEANPHATEADLEQAASRIADQTDNALGMVHQSNVFWNKVLKQSAQASMLSWGWNFGTVRAIGGGALKALRSPSSISPTSADYDPRVSYVVAMPVLTTAMAAIYQLFKTGQMPQEPPEGVGQAFTATTGGKAGGSNEPERAILPGYQKDVLGAWNNILNPKGTGMPGTEVYNKLAPAVRLGVETLTNQDWAGHPIWNPNHPMAQKIKEYFQHVGQALIPIAAQQATQAREGTKIGTAERLLGVRPAPSWVQKPLSTQAFMRGKNERDWKSKVKLDQRLGR